MTFDEAIRIFQQRNPTVDLSTTAGQDAFNAWSGSIGDFENATASTAAFYGHYDLQAAYNAALATNPTLTPDAFAEQWANQNPNDKRLDDPAFLQSVGLTVDTTAVPAEQAWTEYALSEAQKQILADQQRQKEAAELMARYQPGFDAARQTINDLQATVIDGNAYLQMNPDLVADFQAQRAAGSPWAQDVNTYAKTHYDLYGRNEGRPSPYASQTLVNERAANIAASNAQLTALQTQLNDLNAGLTGELAAKGAALQTQLATLTTNLDTLTAAQRQSLSTQLAANFQNLETDVAARRANLSTALTQMGGALTAEAAARRAALEAELGQLNAAQGKLNAVREQGGQALVTAINLGLESTRDQIAAKAAQDGYVGSSTGTDMALTRATIGARQNAAATMADIRTQNESDNAAIARYGAGEGRGIADALAGGQRELGFYGATEGRTLGDAYSGARRELGDFGAAGTRTISDADATSRAQIGAFGAGETRGLADFGASQRRNISDMGANDRRGIADTAAARGLAYFDNDIARRLASLSLPSAALNTELSTRQRLDEYGNTGFNRAAGILGSLGTGSGPAPTAGATRVTAVDSGLENAGAGLLGLAGSIGNANRWWQPSKTANPATGGLGGAGSVGTPVGLEES